LEENCSKPKRIAVEPVRDALAKASERYGELTLVRAAVQAIPWVGGTLDTLLSGRGSKIQYERVIHFLGELDARLHQLEAVGGINEEGFYDLMLNVFDSVIRARSEKKRARFAQLVTNQIAFARSWEDAEMAASLLRDLTETHVAILEAASRAPVCEGSFKGLRVVTLHKEEKAFGASSLPRQDALASVKAEGIRMACSELVSRGLLLDEGVGRLDTSAMEFFVLTDLGRWFLDWLAEPE
jgi:hypothetical protein